MSKFTRIMCVLAIVLLILTSLAAYAGSSVGIDGRIVENARITMYIFGNGTVRFTVTGDYDDNKMEYVVVDLLDNGVRVRAVGVISGISSEYITYGRDRLWFDENAGVLRRELYLELTHTENDVKPVSYTHLTLPTN